ncbi:hypothetical protein [Limnospira sp. PMC 1042.18]|uniref:hypothetical protein n=1 Tax=Limnospira sp. PMC 1042.18 TaxID=2981018 RepID=UPI001986802C|nr:hypothetical protein [Limnospira sp. PMC 1042.18]MDT9196802.1 hypothetical protein [Limnospira sp. PMC 1042.18]
MSRKGRGFPKWEVGRVSLKRKVTSRESYSHITYPHKSFQLDSKRSRFSEVGSRGSLSNITYPHRSFQLDLKRSRFSEVGSWGSLSNITYPHRSFQLDLKRSRFGEVGSWESFPQTESRKLGKSVKYNLPT